jgi:hypothetical protein
MTLHATDAVALVELWAGIKSYVPAKDQRSCADQFIANIDEAGLIDLSITGPELYGVCDTFDKALKTYIQENGLEDDQALEDWD